MGLAKAKRPIEALDLIAKYGKHTSSIQACLGKHACSTLGDTCCSPGTAASYGHADARVPMP
eukprot:1160252-Pelagomonas_calceolata.AAC.15